MPGIARPIAQCLSSPSFVPQSFTTPQMPLEQPPHPAPNPAARAATAALRSDGITSACLHSHLYCCKVKVGKCCLKMAQRSIRHQQVWDLPCPLPQRSGIRSRYFNSYFTLSLTSKWKKEAVLLKPSWFCFWKPSPAAAAAMLLCVPMWSAAVPDLC